MSPVCLADADCKAKQETGFLYWQCPFFMLLPIGICILQLLYFTYVKHKEISTHSAKKVFLLVEPTVVQLVKFSQHWSTKLLPVSQYYTGRCEIS